MDFIDLGDPGNYLELQRINFQAIQLDQLRIGIHGLRYNAGDHTQTPPHRHSFYELHYILDGNITTTINNVKRECEGGQYYLIPPYATHSHENTRPPHMHTSFALRWTMEEIHTEQSNSELEDMYHAIEKAGTMPVADVGGEIANLFREMVRLSHYESMQTELKANFVLLLKAISRQYANISGHREKEEALTGTAKTIIDAAVEYIYANCLGEVNVNEIARHAHVSYSHLARLFSRYTKHTLKSYVIRVRIDHAQHLLLTTDDSVNEISHKLAFANVSHFSHTFKRLTGLSPKLFRTIYGKSSSRNSDPTIM